MGLSKYIFTFYSERVPLHRHTSHYSQNLKLSMYFTLVLFPITKQKTFQKTVNAARPAGFSATVLHWNTFTCKCSSCPTDESEAEKDLQCIYLDVFIWGLAVSSVLSFLRILSSPVPFNCNLLMDSFTLPVKTVITELTVMLSVFHRRDESCH